MMIYREGITAIVTFNLFNVNVDAKVKSMWLYVELEPQVKTMAIKRQYVEILPLLLIV